MRDARDLKFRLRDIDDKILGYEHQRDGRLFYTLRGVNHWFEGFKFLNQVKYRDQFTGLLDKNGKEIYEGDIIRSREDGNLEVIFKDGKFCVEVLRPWHTDGVDEIQEEYFELDHNNDVFIFDDGNWDTCLEVIGNIYENQELLK